MPSQPSADPAPSDGSLPPRSAAAWGLRPFGIYVHVPFCGSRCGYCDFNTYTASELGPGVQRGSFHQSLVQEVSFAREVLGASTKAVRTVFIGGGTPTLLQPAALGLVLDRIRGEFGIAEEAEVTVEANPDTVSPEMLTGLLAIGVNRISFGMQSASPHVLKVLERTHTAGGALRAVAQAEDAGFRKISLDLIYGTPGESLVDWDRTVSAALGSGVSHISAYALIVEQGTRLAAAVRGGQISAPDDDRMAEMYELADERFQALGLRWYELSNWARSGHECQHNLGYWAGDDWWGVGPGAHSHIAGTRWWNVKHPAAYAQRLTDGESPAAGRELLDAEAVAMEQIMLGLRLASGILVAELAEASRRRIPGLLSQGLIEEVGSRVVLTRRGRLLADAVVRDLT